MSHPSGSRVALVTGGNRGIGLAIVAGLAKAGFTVLLGARDRGAGEAARATLGPTKPEVIGLDVTDAASDARCAQRLERLDVLVNNAGVVLDADSSATTGSLGTVREALEVNLFGAWSLTQALLPLLRASRDARIINVSSGMGQLAEMGGGSPGYRVSKTALNALTRMLATELGPAIKVNSVCPGWVQTDMGGAAAPRTPKQGADTVIWLATLPRDETPSGAFLRDRQTIPW